MNNFYGDDQALLEDLNSVRDFLGSVAEKSNAIFKGGEYEAGAGQATSTHAEMNLVQVVRGLIQRGEIKPGSIVRGGISSRYFCSRCVAMGTKVGADGLKIVEQGVTIILRFL